MVLDENFETFIVYNANQKVFDAMSMNHFYIAQVVALHWDKLFTNIVAKYAYFANVFSFDLVMELS